MSERYLRRTVDDEEVVVDLETGQIYGLNETGTAIFAAWQEGVRDPAALAERLAGAFKVTKEAADEAVRAFLAEGRRAGLLREDS